MPMITLRPTGAFHVGQDVSGDRQSVHAYVPSDTLFSAMVVAWAQLGRADDLVRQFNEQPPCLLTSAFPCVLAKGSPPRALVRLAPVPQVQLPADRVLPPKRKKLLRWVSWGVFEKLCAALSLDGEAGDENFVQGNTVWLLRRERDEIVRVWDAAAVSEPWWTQTTVPRVALDRVTNASTLFHAGRVTFAPHIGLWFSVKGGAGLPQVTPLIKSALALLSDSGLGGLRSTGHGAFQWAWEEDGASAGATLTGSAAGYAVTLSRYAPRGREEVAQALQAPGASYQLIRVAGWCDDEALHSWRRRRVRMVTEGSVIGLVGEMPGALVDVRPTGAPQAQFGERRVYRYGYAFPVSVRREALREVVNE